MRFPIKYASKCWMQNYHLFYQWILNRRPRWGQYGERKSNSGGVLPTFFFTRPVGYGYEVRARDDYEVNGKKRSGYLRYMEAFESSWDGEVSRKNPSKSGLDLFGRVEYKPGVLNQEDDESGWFGKIVKAASDAYDEMVRSFVNDTYHLRISPTVVYGNVLASYFRVMDYKTALMKKSVEAPKDQKKCFLYYFRWRPMKVVKDGQLRLPAGFFLMMENL